jgi:branched-chain amino acid transport system substrate-binding protein
LSTVNVGNIGNYSGVLGAVAVGGRQAVEAAVAELNQCGGLDGHQVKLFSADDQGDPSLASSDFESMVQDDHIIALVGPIMYLEANALVPLVPKYGVPVIGGDNDNDQLYWSNPIVFPEGTSFDQLIAATESFPVQQFHLHTIAEWDCVEVPNICGVIHEGWQKGPYLQRTGAKLAISGTVSITAPSYTAQCQQAQAAGVDGIYLTVESASAIRFANSCNQMGYHPIMWGISSCCNNSILSSPLLAQAHWGQALGQFPVDATGTPALDAFHTVFNKYFPNTLQMVATAQGWLSTVLAQVCARGHLAATNPTPQQLIDGCDTIQNNDLGGLAPPLTFHKGGTPTPTTGFFFQYAVPGASPGNAQETAGKWAYPNGGQMIPVPQGSQPNSLS